MGRRYLCPCFNINERLTMYTKVIITVLILLNVCQFLYITKWDCLLGNNYNDGWQWQGALSDNKDTLNSAIYMVSNKQLKYYVDFIDDNQLLALMSYNKIKEKHGISIIYSPYGVLLELCVYSNGKPVDGFTFVFDDDIMSRNFYKNSILINKEIIGTMQDKINIKQPDLQHFINNDKVK